LRATVIEAIKFDLDRRMCDVKIDVQLVGNPLQESISRMSSGHHQMRCQGDVGGAHGPDMQVVHVLDSGQGAQQSIHFSKDDALGHAVEQQVQ
jgi:hypothetical protein